MKWSFHKLHIPGCSTEKTHLLPSTIQIMKYRMRLVRLHHRGSPRLTNWFYNAFHTSNITVSNPETSPHARKTVYEGNLLSSAMIEQLTIQATLSPTEMFNGTKSKFEAWTESIENEVQISGQMHYA